MRVLAVLWTVCLVRLCSAFLCCCGKSKTKDDDDGPYGGSKENLRDTHKPSGQSVASPQVKRGVEQSTNEASPEVTQDATTRQSTPTSEESRVPQLTGQPTITTPITLDLAKPDETNVRVGNQSRDGVNSKKYYPKDGVLISSVMDGGVEVWTAGTGETSGLVNSYTKGDSSLITIGISKGDYLDFKYFEKLDGKWREVTLGDFLNKLDKMREFPNPSPNPSSSHPSPTTTPSQ